ncbi:MAG: hypothetical protein HC881_01505 [Leptolyngbyaceae cyanobacterium SL_7_1]|nr:hypothetical protein [Leptolyngbyaceae cyanobacterium SL_7_1]
MPLDYVSEPVVKDLIHYGRALDLTDHAEPPTWEPSWGKLWNLQEALSAIQPIQPDSPLYAPAQAKAADWQAQIQDLTQLHYANLTASIGHPLTLQLAIDQASRVAPARPRRLQAQTLVAHWGQEIERMDDRPYLRIAEKLATSGTIAAFQQAIGLANQILPNRALRQEAQTAIAQWQDQIEILEDKPILAEAQTLAAADKLQEAIDKANTIPPDRALHAQAQAAIDGWQTKLDEIEIAADRPILIEAEELAAQQRYTLAIEAASQIGSDRALYDQAQAAIAQWQIERQALLDQWALEAPASEESGYTDYPPTDEYSGVEGGAAIEDPLY